MSALFGAKVLGNQLLLWNFQMVAFFQSPLRTQHRLFSAKLTTKKNGDSTCFAIALVSSCVLQKSLTLFDESSFCCVNVWPVPVTTRRSLGPSVLPVPRH